VLSTTRTNAVSDAPPAGLQHALPLVVLSPGFTNSRSVLTALAEDLASHGLSRPFLLLGKQSSYTPGSGGAVTTWERDWRLLTGWKRWLLVAGAIHASFSDLGLLADQVGIDVGAGLPGARSLDITRVYVRAFFDQHLRSEPQALLDQPSPRYPEVTFCSPGG
jgi:hypothetical protein